MGGNIINASPISDLNPTFMAAGTKLNLASKGNSCSLMCSGSRISLACPENQLISLPPLTRVSADDSYGFQLLCALQADVSPPKRSLGLLPRPLLERGECLPLTPGRLGRGGGWRKERRLRWKWTADIFCVRLTGISKCLKLGTNAVQEQIL